jgi:hypothetical protein
MNDHFTIVESRMETDGIVRHIVQAPGGTIVVREDDAGNLSGRIRSGYVATEENEEQTLARALEAVRELHQGPNSAQEIELNRVRDFLDK